MFPRKTLEVRLSDKGDPGEGASERGAAVQHQDTAVLQEICMLGNVRGKTLITKTEGAHGFIHTSFMPVRTMYLFTKRQRG